MGGGHYGPAETFSGIAFLSCADRPEIWGKFLFVLFGPYENFFGTGPEHRGAGGGGWGMGPKVRGAAILFQNGIKQSSQV